MVERWDRRSAGEQQRVQRRLLASWLPQATGFAPHWAQAATAAGMAPGEVTTLGDLRRLTPTIQGDVVANGGAALVQRPTDAQLRDLVPRDTLQRLGLRRMRDPRRRRRELMLAQFKPVHALRGGLGERLAIVSSRADLDRAMRAGARAAAVLGLTDHDSMVSAVPAGPSAAYHQAQVLGLGSHVLGLHPRGHGDDLDRCVDAFGLLPATAVACLPDEAIAWAEVLRSRDADVSRVVRVLLMGPPGDEAHRGAVEEAWRSAGALEHELVVRHVWSPDVLRGPWAECREGISGLHTMPDLDHLEVVDADSGRAHDGPGDLTVTSVGWRGTTLLRHRTGVRIAGLATVPCPDCRRTVPRVVGAVEQAAWHLCLEADGRRRWLDTRAFDDAVGGLAGIDEWRVVVRADEGRDGYHVEVAGMGGAAARLAARVKELTAIEAASASEVDDPGALAAQVASRGRVVDDR